MSPDKVNGDRRTWMVLVGEPRPHKTDLANLLVTDEHDDDDE